MTSNIYTKNEILQALSAKGYFIDIYTLDTFFKKWNIEAIFEDEQGGEFFDKNTLDIILNNLFNQKNEQEHQQQQISSFTQSIQPMQNSDYVQPNVIQPTINNQYIDSETQNILSNVSLSDGTPLINKVNDNFDIDISSPVDMPELNESIHDIQSIEQPEEPIVPKKRKLGILEGAMQTLDENTQQEIIQSQEQRQEVIKEIEETEKTLEDFQNQTQQIAPKNSTFNINQNTPPMPDLTEQNETSDGKDFDDISLISDSFEAQEKFKEYVVNEFTKQQPAPAPANNNEFKLDISERTINMIARTMAKKIAKHVSAICSADTKAITQLEEIKQENKRLEQRAKELENQNKKLRLLLAESNKNLNSYKPSIFGLYKKVPPQ